MAPFENDRLSDFYIQDKDTFFNPTTRSRIVSLRDICIRMDLLSVYKSDNLCECLHLLLFLAAKPGV